MVILSLIVKRTRVKALVKDKRAALEAFGTYVEVGGFFFANLAVTFLNLSFIFPMKNTGSRFWCCVQSMSGDASDRPFLKRALRGVRTIICPNVCISRLYLLN